MDEKYSMEKYVAGGTGGNVFQGVNKLNGNIVAIKSIQLIYPKKDQCKRLYREICVLKHINSSFTLSLLDVYVKYQNKQLVEVLLILPFMEYDLKKIISDFNLYYKQIIQIIYQILMGLEYLYDSGIIHRDLKPSNIGINKNLDLRLLDFGLARDKQDDLTEYVVTRWYRPLEVFCTSQYTMAVDMWSAGCILVELFTNKVLFPGKNTTDQSICILKVMGWPSSEMLDKINNKDIVLGLQLFKSFAAESNQLMKIIQKPIECSVLADENVDDNCLKNVINLIFEMLELDPDNRISPSKALNSSIFTKHDSYISSYVESGKAREFKCNSFPENDSVDFWKDEIVKEIENFNPRN